MFFIIAKYGLDARLSHIPIFFWKTLCIELRSDVILNKLYSRWPIWWKILFSLTEIVSATKIITLKSTNCQCVNVSLLDHHQVVKVKMSKPIVHNVSSCEPINWKVKLITYCY